MAYQALLRGNSVLGMPSALAKATAPKESHVTLDWSLIMDLSKCDRGKGLTTSAASFQGISCDISKDLSECDAERGSNDPFDRPIQGIPSASEYDPGGKSDNFLDHHIQGPR